MTIIKFKQNESFYIREGWFEKALHAINDSRDEVFSKDNGVKKLGIGSNMVKSLRYWLKASKITETKGSNTDLTEFGQLLYQYDPYLENDFSWYMIHYNLCSNRQDCPIFFELFNSEFLTFSKDKFCDYLKNRLIGSSEDPKKNKYIEEDLNVCLKSYINENPDANPEENYVCPLASLKMMKKDHDIYKRIQPKYSSLPAVLIYYVLYKMHPENHFDIKHSFREENSPFLLFNLDKSTYLQYLDELKRQGFITINKTAGLNEVYFEKQVDMSYLFSDVFGGR